MNKCTQNQLYDYYNLPLQIKKKDDIILIEIRVALDKLLLSEKLKYQTNI